VTADASARLRNNRWDRARENYRLMSGKHIAPALGSKALGELTPADIRAFARKVESMGTLPSVRQI
jgi:hypothetical protein